MDNLAHTLAGLTLAEAGLGRRSARATLTLAIAANLPDIDGLAMLGGTDFALWFRRGWTHGAPALVLLPIVLTAVMLLPDARRPREQRANPKVLLALAYLGVLTHPVLDWMNTYGVRLLMPFDGRWFYGDALLIVDPWLWLLGAAAVVVGRSHSKPGLATWLVLGTATTGMMLFIDVVPLSAKLAWIVGLVLIVALRLRLHDPEKIRSLGVACAALIAVYCALMAAGSALAREQARRWFDGAGFQSVAEVMAGPLPARPFARDIVAVADGHYHFLELDWLGTPTLREVLPSRPVPQPNAVIHAALEAPEVQGLRNWLRLPDYVVTREPEGWTVLIRDLRYAREETRGFATATVRLDEELQPR